LDKTTHVLSSHPHLAKKKKEKDGGVADVTRSSQDLARKVSETYMYVR